VVQALWRAIAHLHYCKSCDTLQVGPGIDMAILPINRNRKSPKSSFLTCVSSNKSVRKRGGAVDTGFARFGKASIAVRPEPKSARVVVSGSWCALLARCIAGEHRSGNMRITNPAGVFGIRLATERAVPVWSGFGSGSINRARPHSPAKQATSAKVALLKRVDARSAAPFFAGATSCSLRLQTVSHNGCCGEGGV
jgi:hypothetical protein